MDVARGIGAPFRDQQWIIKSLLGGVWAVVPFTWFALTGYYLDYIRNTAYGRETPLPEWSLFGRYWVRGLLASVAMFVYLLPAVVLMGLAFVTLVPVAAYTTAFTGYHSQLSYYPGPDALLAGGACAAIGLAAIYSIAAWVFIAAALTHYAMYEEFGSVFALGDIKRRLTTPGASYATALLMSIVITVVVSVVASVVTVVFALVPLLGTIASWFASAVIGFLGSLMAAHLFGQYASRAYSLPGLAPVSYATPPAAPPTPPAAPPAAPQPPVAPSAASTPPATPPAAPEQTNEPPEPSVPDSRQ